MKSYQVDKDGYYGEFGGAYIPEILHKCVEELKNTYICVSDSYYIENPFNQYEYITYYSGYRGNLITEEIYADVD